MELNKENLNKFLDKKYSNLIDTDWASENEGGIMFIKSLRKEFELDKKDEEIKITKASKDLQAFWNEIHWLSYMSGVISYKYNEFPKILDKYGLKTFCPRCHQEVCEKCAGDESNE